MTLDEINRLRALKAKDDGIAFDLAVLQVADRLLDASSADKARIATLETALAAMTAERDGLRDAARSACHMAFSASYLGFDRAWGESQINGIQNTIVREEMQALARTAVEGRSNRLCYPFAPRTCDDPKCTCRDEKRAAGEGER